MRKKAPRKTAQRILIISLELFNQFGHLNVSTGLISSKLNISSGNLYYHYPSKDFLVNRLFDDFEQKLSPLLNAGDDVSNIEDLWFFLHLLLELIWQYRFLYRDLNSLLHSNVYIEKKFAPLLVKKQAIIEKMLSKIISASYQQILSLSKSITMSLTCWLNYEYILNPRKAMEQGQEQNALISGAGQIMGQIYPYLNNDEKSYLEDLINIYIPK